MRGPPYIAGRLGPRELPIQSVWRRLGGFEYERRWWGPADEVRKLEFLARNGAIEVGFTQSPGSSIGILSARYAGVIAGDEIAEETMEINFNDESIPIHRNPTFIDISVSRIAALNKAATDNDSSVPSQTDGGIELEYWSCKVEGDDSYLCALPHVTWTRTVSENYSRDLDLGNVGAIFTTEALVDAMGAPILFSVPTGNVGVRESDGWTAGWRKLASTEITSEGKVNLVITGTFGLWRNSLYTIA